MPARTITSAALLGATMLAAGCSNPPSGPAYNPEIPTSWSGSVTNSFFVLTPGTTYQFSGQTAEGLETTTIEVLSTTKVINGVTTTVVRDRVYLAGNLIEDTMDWYAQDAAGNVWYLGEDSKEIENGQVVSTEGSWEWGKDGALPGIIMWADPGAHVGETYRQEYARGEAEDWARVVAVSQTAAVPYGNLTGCVKTEDWNGLESGGRENKFYCPGVGLALEVAIQGGERLELLSKTP